MLPNTVGGQTAAARRVDEEQAPSEHARVPVPPGPHTPGAPGSTRRASGAALTPTRRTPTIAPQKHGLPRARLALSYRGSHSGTQPPLPTGARSRFTGGFHLCRRLQPRPYRCASAISRQSSPQDNARNMATASRLRRRMVPRPPPCETSCTLEAMTASASPHRCPARQPTGNTKKTSERSVRRPGCARYLG